MLPNPIRYHVYTGQELPSPWPYDYVLAREGVVKRMETPHVYAEALVATGANIAGLSSWPFDIRLKVPPIPVVWLESILGHARRAGSNGLVSRPIEQMYYLHYIDQVGWRVSIPRQEASASRVSYQGAEQPTIVVELHSHHAIGAYFSPVDDRDEQGARFYAVIGRIFTVPEITLRLGMHGDWLGIDPLFLFEGLGPFRVASEREIRLSEEVCG